MKRDDVLTRMGEKFESAYRQDARLFRSRILGDPSDVPAHIGLADTNILLYVFGYISREDTIREAGEAVEAAKVLDPGHPDVMRLAAILHFLDWNWLDAEDAFKKAVERDPHNLSTRHWYSLYLIAMGRFDEAMTQSDRIMEMDPDENFLVGRGSLLYFQHRFEELRELMLRTIDRDPSVPWGYDWLGMAYNGLEQHDASIRTYRKAFALSDGTAEVGAGLGHALGLAGEIEEARQIAGFYADKATERYVPPVQRAYIHIGIGDGDYDEAIRLLEQAFVEQSWFLMFAKVEPWLDPLRGDKRFADLLRRMDFPDSV